MVMWFRIKNKFRAKFLSTLRISGLIKMSEILNLNSKLFLEWDWFSIQKIWLFVGIKFWINQWKHWKLSSVRFTLIFENFRFITDREWTEMIADDHVLNVEMPRFPNLFNISIFWHGSNANLSSLLHSYCYINPVWHWIVNKFVSKMQSVPRYNTDRWWVGHKVYDPLTVSIRSFYSTHTICFSIRSLNLVCRNWTFLRFKSDFK